MRYLVLLAAALSIGAASPLGAAELSATSKVDSVTVFPAGAEVRRLARFKIEAGDHTIVLNDLPQQALPGSIRVEGKATGKLEIGAVDSRRIVVPRAGADVARTERRRIEDQIERLKDERAGFEGRVETAETQKAFIRHLTELPSRPAAPPAGQVAQPREDWTQLLLLIGSSMTEVNRSIQDAQQRIRDIDRRIKELERELSAQAPPLEERTEVKVHVRAQTALEADLVVRYQVPNASWTPLYDARLNTGAKNVAPQLTLTRRAAITQRTGEPWQDVALTLSTTRPSSNATAPDLRPITVDFVPERPPAAEAQATARDASELAAKRRSAFGETAMSPPPPAAAPMMQAAAEQQASIVATDFQATYGVPGRVSVENTGETKRVQIDEAQFEPALIVRAVPKREERAFLYAKLALAKGSVYLPGPISLFRDQTFVGASRLPQLTGGEEHELGFGADDSVRIRYSIADEKRGETGLISTSRTDQRNYRITIKNLHERPVAFTVLDQVPASLNQEIKVELIGRTAPTRRDVEDKRGVLAWEDKLAPDEERMIEFGYRITWPAAKNITFRP